MKKTSTPSPRQTIDNTSVPSADDDCKTAVGPKESTLNFLRQLARCYSPEPSLSIASLSGSILN